MSSCKILAITNNGGVCYHRVINPMMSLKELYGDYIDVFFINVNDNVTHNLPDIKTTKIDIIYFNTSLGFKDDDIRLSYLEQALSSGAKLVMDIDDHFKYGRSVIVDKRIADAHELNTIKSIGIADYITTTTDAYRQILLQYNKNVNVFSNFIDYDVKPKTKSKRIRFGLTGAIMHKYDMEILRGVAYKLKKQGLIDFVQFVLCGYTHHKVHVEYEKILTSDYSIVSTKYKKILKNTNDVDVVSDDEPYIRFGWRDLKDYMSIYDNIDVLLAPLENTRFNDAKSQIKYIEAGHTRTLFVGSNTTSYTPFVIHGQNGFLANNSNDFFNIIKSIVEVINIDISRFEKIKDNAQLDVARNFSKDIVTKQRFDFFMKIKESGH